MGGLEVKWCRLSLDKIPDGEDSGMRWRDDGFRQIFQGRGCEERKSRLEKPTHFLRGMESGRGKEFSVGDMREEPLAGARIAGDKVFWRIITEERRDPR